MDADAQPQHVSDLLALIEQAVAGVTLVEELLDGEQPGWDAGTSSRRRPAGAGGSLAYIRTALHTTWTNAGWILVHDFGVEPWRVPPLAVRQQGGGYHVWQRGPDGADEIIEVADWEPKREPTPGPVREVPEPTERRYTLDEARAVLAQCASHDWVLDLDDAGQPSGARCANPLCGTTTQIPR